MVAKKIKRLLKQKRTMLLRHIRRHSLLVGMVVLAGVGSLILGNMQPSYPLHTGELLDMIAKAESRSNYNAYFGNPNNTSIVFTDMSVGEVLDWQKQYVAQGSPSSAVGRYQLIDSTLQGLVEQLDINRSATFDEAMQDRLAVALLERRGIREYADNKLSPEAFAHNLSKEWAGLPKIIGTNPEQSYYAGDGLNKAQVSVSEVLASVATVRKVQSS